MRVFIKRHPHHAGKWIYRGYASAWQHLGYDVVLYDFLSEILERDTKESYLMTLDSCILDEGDIDKISHFEKTFSYVQPNAFPSPWGSHPNYISACPPNMIEAMNKMDSVKLWSWCAASKAEKKKLYSKWKDVETIDLAFDSVNYKRTEDCPETYDVCFVGGWANNGFNEKRRIMLEHFTELKKTNLKCGIFINKNLTHEQENHVLSSSKVALNIHDSYQRKLGLDSNERTFKSLGLTGALVCDNIAQVNHIFPSLELYDNPTKMVEMINHHVGMPRGDLQEVKESNRKLINDKHTYIKRVERMLSL